MIFRCPCGFVNDVDVMPADRRITCMGCRKTWVVSKAGRKRRRIVRNVYMGAALLAALVPWAWPMSPVLVVVLGGRLALLRLRHRPVARVVLAALTAVIWGLLAATALALGMSAAGWIGLRGHPEGLMRLGEICLELRILLDQWGWMGWVVFAVMVVCAAIVPFVGKVAPDVARAGWFEKGQKFAIGVLAVVAGVGPFSLFAHGSIDSPAAAAERRLQERYVAAERSYQVQQRRIALVKSVSAALTGGLRPEDAKAFDKELASATSAGAAVDIAQRYVDGPGFITAPGLGLSAATQPADSSAAPADVLWHAMTSKLWGDEQRRTAQAEADEINENAEYSAAIEGLEQVAAKKLNLPRSEHAEAIGTFFTGIIDFAIDHLPADLVDRKRDAVATAILRLADARELNIRQTVAHDYQQAMVASTIEHWQPDSRSASATAKVITIENDSPDELTFWAVGPIVKEAYIPPGAKQDVTLDESNYQAILVAGSASPCVLELGYGSGHLNGKFTKQETWIADTP